MSLHDALQEFGRDLTANFAVAEPNPAQAEDQLKGPMQRLFHAAGPVLGLDVVARTEARTELGVRPDLGVSVGSLLAGHVELKAPGKGVRRAGFTNAHDRSQFDRLRDHPNLLYTDGNQWALYRNGRLVGKVIEATGDIRMEGNAAYSEDDARMLEAVLRDFLTWEPIVPSTPKALAALLAPLTRLLRETVHGALTDPESALSQLAGEWRNVFFPDATDEQFADAYAQTVTYALLLARVEGETDLHARAAERLDARHGLLAQVLRVLADPAARHEVESAVDLLERAIAAVDPPALARRTRKQDLWLYFYEDFLAAYDHALRRQRGVYFTPAQVVHAQTAFVAQLLRERFGKDREFADDGVTVLDPAVGTGTYLLAAFQRGLERVRELFGPGATPGRASIMAEQFHGFEILIGPYAVAHLRVAQRIVEARGDLPQDGAHVYLTDTLESPHLAPPGLAHAPLFQRKLAEENERARKIKAETPIVVCLGNPPYSRHEAGELGGWIRHGDEGEDGILEDFLRDAPPVHAKNLYNLYVYFWRWALWKVFENPPGKGIVSFITASSYLRGPGFVGMRRFMRETFDELWILDLGGDNLGARKTENVFAIQNPVAIAVGVRSTDTDASLPAHVRYARVEGTREEKLATLAAVDSLSDVEWSDCFTGWQQPFLPESQGDYFAWPLLTDLFPWQHSGVQFKRTWPIAPARDTLARRWERLVASPEGERAALFVEARDRKVTRTYAPLLDGERMPPVSELTRETPMPPIIPYAYRSLSPQYCLADSRVGDFLRPALWRTLGARQLFLTSLLTGVLGEGPAAIVTNLIPDLHHFRGSYGGKDAVPLWRDARGTEPNITNGLLESMSETLDHDLTPEDLFAYCYAVLSAPDYTERFAEELAVPGPRIPLTRDPALFRSAIDLGERLIWLHTYGERFVPDGEDPGRIPAGAARCTEPVGTTAESYPTSHDYNEEKAELHVGDGVFAPVPAEVRSYSVSGLDVIGSWLDYRMRDGAGRRSSALDAIRPTIWPAQFTEDLLRLIWAIEPTVALTSELNAVLAAIVEGPTIPADELPTPSDRERQPPTVD